MRSRDATGYGSGIELLTVWRRYLQDAVGCRRVETALSHTASIRLIVSRDVFSVYEGGKTTSEGGFRRLRGGNRAECRQERLDNE